MIYCLTFTVEGRGAFPVDMLRYDHCFPSETADALNIAVSRDSGDLYFNENRRVNLVRAQPSKRGGPTDARWESFGWRVVPGSTSVA